MGLKPPLNLEGPKIGFCSTPALIAGAAADSDLTAGGSDTDSDSSTTRSLIETHLEKGTKQGNMSEADNAQHGLHDRGTKRPLLYLRVPT
jgi:hypothetical protein